MDNTLCLSASQREAVFCTAGVCEIIAGPGSGKTTVLIRHILFLIRSMHQDPSSILVLTFSRAAALSMRLRFFAEAENAGLGDLAHQVTFSTFHAFFYHVLRRCRGNALSVIPADERRKLLERLTEEFYPDARERPLPDEMEAIVRDREGKGPRRDPAGRSVSAAYRSYLEENGLVDFDTILSDTLSCMRGEPLLLKELRERFSCIVTDEMQDIDPVQYEMLRLLAEGQRVYSVGDDDQSIYGFRGTSPKFMRDFQRDFPGCRVLYLEDNYRCASRISDASLKIIGCNRKRIRKDLRAVRPGGEVHLIACRNEKEEMQRTAEFLRRKEAAKNSGAAVICRTNRQAAAFRRRFEETEDRERDIAADILQTAQGRKLHREISLDLKAYLSLAEQIGTGTLPRRDLMQILNRPPRYLERSTAGSREEVFPEELLRALSGRPASQKEMRMLLMDLKNLSGMKPFFFCRYLLESMGYGAFIRKLYPSIAEPVLDLMRKTALESANAAEWIRKWENTEEASQARSLEGNVRFMTMHACKGLEFDTVILPGLNEGLLPSRRSRSEEELEEERRLLYVAMTRARDCLVLIFSVGSPENPRLPSRFLRPLGVKMQGLNTPGKCGRMINPVGKLGRKNRS